MARTKESNRITALAVRGFKSIRSEQRIAIKPLTVLAGANSSGKSSIMQPLLLMKQTLEAPADPGALLLDGPNVKFTSTEQILSKRTGNKAQAASFSIRIEASDGTQADTVFVKQRGYGFDLHEVIFTSNSSRTTISRKMTSGDIELILPNYLRKIVDARNAPYQWSVVRDRCLFRFALLAKIPGGSVVDFAPPLETLPGQSYGHLIQSMLHLPGLRGNPQRNYSRTTAGPRFPGTFEAYFASLIFQWQADDSPKLALLSEELRLLGLTWKISARPVDDTQVELQIGRLSKGARGGAQDLVSIADVGLGVSQSLPVLVALQAADPGQLVYLEQPEIHLHPKAQRLMARSLCRAAKRGLSLVVETHSAILLREIQTQIALGEMPQSDVALHWLQRNDQGDTEVTTAEPDENGAYGEWPVDFDDTDLESERAYLDAVEGKATR